ncbi:Trans-aconitate 2-methyltransferase [subsurface metagenome]
MRVVTDWNRYHKRTRISQNFLWTIWRAYSDLLRGIHFKEPIKIIELGCGTAYHTLQMTKLFPVDKVTLVDFNPNVLNAAQKRLSCLNCEKEFLLRDLFNLDLSEKYDIVHSQGLLEHYTPDEQQKLICLHRDLLTPNGITIILVPTPSLPYRLWRGLLEKLHLWIYPDETAISEEQFSAELKYSGLQILKMKKCHLIELGAVCRRGRGYLQDDT